MKRLRNDDVKVNIDESELISKEKLVQNRAIKPRHKRGRSVDFEEIVRPDPEMITGIELSSPIHQEASGTLLIDERNKQGIEEVKNEHPPLSYANLVSAESSSNYSTIDWNYLAKQRAIANEKMKVAVERNGKMRNSNPKSLSALPKFSMPEKCSRMPCSFFKICFQKSARLM